MKHERPGQKATVNSRLRAAREKRGWSQNELAKRLDVNELTVGRWERGERSPQLLYRARLCELFGMTAEELGLSETAERLTEVEAPRPHAFLSISSTSSPLETCLSPEQAVKQNEIARLASVSLKPISEMQPLQSSHWPRHRRSLQLLVMFLLSIALAITVVLYSLHLLFPTPLPALTSRFHAAASTPTPVPLWHSWPQVLNDALQATDYNQAWEVDQSISEDSNGMCDFSSLSHTYQLQTLGSNYCPYGGSHAHPWTDLAYSIDLSIRQGNWGGPIIRLRQGNYYYFDISITGTYELVLHQYANGGQDREVVSGSSAAIHQGLNQWNTLLILAQGPSFQLWINGQYVTAITDRTLSVGTIGVAGSYGDSHSAPWTEVWFRHAQVWRPAGSS